MSAPNYLEPAIRDPKKLRLTAWILVGVMVVGGWLVMTAYNKWVSEREDDTRPAIPHRIQPERSLRFARQDGKQADLMDLRSKVFVLNVVHTAQIEESEDSLKVMKRLAVHYSGKDDFRLVTLMLDPGPADELIGKLQTTASEYGMELPKWWLGSNEQETLKTFIRKELEPSVVPEEVDGRWLFDTSIVLVDRNGHLRRAVVPQKRGGPPYIAPFDFTQAAQWDAEGIKTGTDLTNGAQLEKLLRETIDTLLEEPYQP